MIPKDFSLSLSLSPISRFAKTKTRSKPARKETNENRTKLPTNHPNKQGYVAVYYYPRTPLPRSSQREPNPLSSQKANVQKEKAQPNPTSSTPPLLPPPPHQSTRSLPSLTFQNPLQLLPRPLQTFPSFRLSLGFLDARPGGSWRRGEEEFGVEEGGEDVG